VLALALNAGVLSVLLAVNIDAVLPLAPAAVPRDLWVFPFERGEVSANVFKFIPAPRGGGVGRCWRSASSVRERRKSNDTPLNEARLTSPNLQVLCGHGADTALLVFSGRDPKSLN
jgi:hypothetical protein